ncbi:DDE-type integrase/transposase/recombinase [Candidatus Pacearchaeota archaeon]|nr:DDE-type integrase/transposase/recombinase [Candidatus Pacearchaeota archaeon]
MKQEIICEKCDGKNIKKDGIRETKNRGKVQRYKCLSCSHRFSIDDGFWKMKNHEDKITSCMNMYYAGMSLRKIQEHLQMFAPKNSHYSTIYRWNVKYANMISTLTNNLQIESGIELMSDELDYHRLGEQNWFVDVMDTTTRYVVASDYMKSRTIENLTKVLKKGKLATGEQIKVVTTDGLKGYERVLKKSFGLKTHWNHKSPIIHNVVIASERGFNHKIERLHNTIRDRTKIMRGFHGSLESARAIMKGMEIYYNFVRKHQGIDNKTPQEEAIPELTLSTNKWLSLIKLAKL